MFPSSIQQHKQTPSDTRSDQKKKSINPVYSVQFNIKGMQGFCAFLVTRVYISMHSCSTSIPNSVTLIFRLGIQPGKESCRSNEVYRLTMTLSNRSIMCLYEGPTCTCRRRGREGLYSRSSGASLWVPRSKRGIGTRCHGGCRPLVVEASWVHGDWGPGLGAG